MTLHSVIWHQDLQAPKAGSPLQLLVLRPLTHICTPLIPPATVLRPELCSHRPTIPCTPVASCMCTHKQSGLQFDSQVLWSLWQLPWSFCELISLSALPSETDMAPRAPILLTGSSGFTSNHTLIYETSPPPVTGTLNVWTPRTHDSSVTHIYIENRQPVSQENRNGVQ